MVRNKVFFFFPLFFLKHWFTRNDDDGSGLGTESVSSAAKQHKMDDVDLAGDLELPRTRNVILRFSSTGSEIPGRVVSRESFGILVKATEDAPLCVPPVKSDDRFWTKFCGVLQPLTRTPVVEVIHAVKNK